MSKIYNVDNGDAYVVNRGWIPYGEYTSLSNKAFYKKIDDTIELFKLSPVFIDDNMIIGNQDFLLDEWQTENTKRYFVKIRSFKSGRGFKRVADNIIDLGLWYGNKKDIVEKMNTLHTDKLSNGYELQVIKNSSYGL